MFVTPYSDMFRLFAEPALHDLRGDIYLAMESMKLTKKVSEAVADWEIQLA
jgi:hypothetical protein